MSSKWFLAVLVQFIVILLLIVLLFHKPSVKVVPFNDKPYLDSIADLKRQSLKLDSAINNLNIAYQQLELHKKLIHTIYAKKLEFVYTASPFQLDSIISESVR